MMTDLESRAFRENVIQIISLLHSELDAAERPRILTALLALKRLADQRAELEEQSLDLTGFLAFAPDWRAITSAESPAETLTAAFSRLEDAHPSDERWFDGLRFREIHDEVLKKIIDIVSEFSFRDADLDKPEAFSEFLLHLCRGSNPRSGCFETPPSLTHLLTMLLAPEDQSSICDPFCLSGETLVNLDRHFRKHATLCAQTPNDYTHIVMALVLLVNNCPDVKIATGDVIRAPGFLGRSKRVMKFDRVFGIIPAGIKNWGYDPENPDSYYRFIYGVPPRSRGEFAYLSHAIASLAEGGRLVVTVPAVILFRGSGSEKIIRKAIINDDRVEAVIALPLRIFPSCAVKFVVLIITAGKNPEREGKTIFIDASGQDRTGGRQNTLSDEDISRVLKAYTSFKTDEGFSTVASTEEIAANDFDLDVSRYVLPPLTEEATEEIDMDEAVAELEEIRKKKADALKRFLKLAAGLDQNLKQ